MALTLDKIDSVVLNMDQTYDANFGEWIRNEENCKIIAYHLKRYILQYPTHDFVVVLKWIVKDWTLRSIIVLSKMMMVTDLELEFDRKIDILQGLVHTWHPAFIGEFITSTCKLIEDPMKKSYIKKLLENFEINRVQNILQEIGDKIESCLKESVLCEHDLNKHRTIKQKKKQLLDAFNIL